MKDRRGRGELTDAQSGQRPASPRALRRASCRRGGAWWSWSLRFGLPLAVLLVEVALLGHSRRGPVAVPSPPVRPPSAEDIQICTSVVTRDLRRDLTGMGRGAVDPAADPRGAVDAYAHTSALGQQIALARQRVMQTAGPDFFARFDRDVDREMAAYGLRLAGACTGTASVGAG